MFTPLFNNVSFAILAEGFYPSNFDLKLGNIQFLFKNLCFVIIFYIKCSSIQVNSKKMHDSVPP